MDQHLSGGNGHGHSPFASRAGRPRPQSLPAPARQNAVLALSMHMAHNAWGMRHLAASILPFRAPQARTASFHFSLFTFHSLQSTLNP